VLRFRRVLIALVVVLAVPVASASASSTQEASFQDNALLLFNQAHLDQTLQTLRLLGVGRLRISVVWYLIAPAPNSRRKPAGFNASNPAAYPAANWAPYDTIVAAAAKYGMGVNFNLMGGAPLWAVRRAPAAYLARVWYPSASAFGAFATAVGRRYSGTYKPRGASTTLPRVSYWSIWNEPNVNTSSLSPQTVNGVEVGPRLYRSLANAAYDSLLRTGHRPGRDTILVGELASTGHANPGNTLGMQPLRFLRALYCVDSGYRQLRGRAAAARGCPTSAAASRGFSRANPALFNATGWSHHPYHLTEAPNAPSPPADADWVTFADLPKLERALTRTQLAYGSHKRFPVYLTEYGFDTNPPQRENAVGLATQASYLNQAEYMAWHDPRIRTLTQYLLQDAPQIESVFSAFASGLVFANGTQKPSFGAYRLPLWMPTVKAHRGESLEVWGCIRPSHFAIPDTGRAQTAQIQFQPGSSGPFMWFTTVTVRRANSCYFDVRLKFPESGRVRVAYTYPSNDPTLPAGTTVYSRGMRITLR
jgi:hypothetical protein